MILHLILIWREWDNYNTIYIYNNIVDKWARAFLKWQSLLSRDRRAKAPEMATWCWFWWAHHSRPCSLCSLCSQCWCLQHFKMRLWQIHLTWAGGLLHPHAAVLKQMQTITHVTYYQWQPVRASKAGPAWSVKSINRHNIQTKRKSFYLSISQRDLASWQQIYSYFIWVICVISFSLCHPFNYSHPAAAVSCCLRKQA